MVKRLTIASDNDPGRIANDTVDGASSPLDDLASEARGGPTPPGDSPQEEAHDAAAAAAAAAAFEKMQAGMRAMVLGALKALRGRIGRTLPEIHEYWPDAMLEPPADAAPAVIQKWLAKLMPAFMVDYPEETALLMSCVPLLLAYVDAAGAAAAKTVDATSSQGPTP